MRYTASVPPAFVAITARLLELSRSATLITPNERLARELGRALRTTPPPNSQIAPRVMSWRSFVREAYRGDRQLLGDQALRALLASTAQMTGLQTLLRDAVEAWTISHQYAIQPVEQSPVHTWFEDTSRRLDELNAITSAELEAWAISQPAPVQHLALIGFEHRTPAQQALLRTWSAHGMTLDELEPATSLGSGVRVELPDRATEARAAAWWCRETLQREPDARIGVIFPDIVQRHAAIARQFGVVLDPARGSRSPCFDVSGGQPMQQLPAWRDANTFLSAFVASQPADGLQQVARSRHFQWQPDLANMPWLLDWQTLQQLNPDPTLAALLETHEAAVPPNGLLSLADWVELFMALLERAGWGSTRAGSVQFQAIRALRGAIWELAAQPLHDCRYGQSQALGLINAALSERTFSAQRPTAPVQVLGHLETTGLSFTHLWIAGADDRNLPGTPSPNPLLPIEAQRARGVPRVDAEAELAFSEERLRGWLGAADMVIASHATQIDGADCAVSPLLRHWEMSPPPSTPQAHPYLPLPSLLHEMSQPWQTRTLPPGRLAGGSGALKSQSVCPLQAFAVHRLRSQTDEHPHSYPDAREIGTLIHEVLESLYRRHPTPEHLAEVSQATVNRQVSVALNKLSDAHRPSEGDEGPALNALVQRVGERVSAWIALDLDRPSWEIARLEDATTVTLGEYDVRVVIDRIDKVGAAAVVIDYKTGNVDSTRALAAEVALRSAQLPLYAQADGSVAAVLYAKVQEPPAYAGISAEGLELPGRGVVVAEDWEKLKQHWLTELTQLAEQFAKAPATPSPIHTSACRSCPVRGFCRAGVEPSA